MGEKNHLNVLVVDPEEATVVELKDLLSAEGYRVHVAADSRAVVEEVKHGKYQMVLLDVSPPADASIDLLEQIRAADSDICVITMTAMPSVAVAVRAMKRQAFDYLQKPLADEELRHVIDAAIREKGLLVDIETRLNQIVGGRLRELRGSAGLTLLPDRAREERRLHVDAPQARDGAPGQDDLLLRDRLSGVGSLRGRQNASRELTTS
jgi:DNA-binding NtrC family response regulator